MSGDLKEAITMLAADNARLCGPLAAEKALSQARRSLNRLNSAQKRYLKDALDEYDASGPS